MLRRSSLLALFAVVGPGVLAGLSDDDPAGITTYSLLGADYGYELLWVLALSTAALVLFHEFGARMGVVTGQGLTGLIRERYGVRLATLALLFLVVANVGTTCAEFAGVAAGLELAGSCPPDMPLRMVAQMMARYRIHCVIVFADPDESHLDGHVWGVVSDLDLVAAADDLDGRTAGATAATEVVTVPSDATLAEARRLMVDHQVAHLVVVDPRSERPVGVLSTLDIARVLVGSAAPLESDETKRVEKLRALVLQEGEQAIAEAAADGGPHDIRAIVHGYEADGTRFFLDVSLPR